MPVNSNLLHPNRIAYWWLALVIFALVLASPLAVTQIPPLLDYPNHLARMAILAANGADPVLARMYAIQWPIVPNIGIDLTMPPLVRLLGLYAAGKLFVALALALPLLGVALLHRAVFRTVSLWPMAAGLVCANRLFFTGFLNFLIGVGLALLAAALWEFQRSRPAWARVGAAMVAAIAIFFCHLIALAFYGLLLVALEGGACWRAKRWPVGRLALVAVPFVVPAILYLRAPIGGGHPADPAAGHGLVALIRGYYWALAAEPHGLKPLGLIGPFLTYNRLFDAGAILLLIVVLVPLARARQVAVAPGMIGALLLLLLLYPLTPFFLMETAWVDQRLPVLAAFVLFAAVSPTPRNPRTAQLVTLAVAAALLARTVEIGFVWAAHDRTLADFRQTIAPVGPGERVLVVQAERNADPKAMVNDPDSVRAMLHNDSTMHLPALLVIERKAFWPLLFTARTKQPVRVNPPYDSISLPEGELPWVGGLASPNPETLRWAPYLADWEGKFDWVLLLHPGWVENGYELLPDRLEPAAASPVAALYKIRR